MTNVLKVAEMILLFVLLPLLYFLQLMPSSLFVALVVVFVFCLVLLLRDKTFDNTKFRIKGIHKFTSWKQGLKRWAIATLLITLYTVLFEREYLFSLIQENVFLWILICLTYPIISALPQEIIYRAFFFHRYRSLFSNEKIFLLVNALLFSFLHIVFLNWFAVAVTFVGSFLFADTYKRSESVMVTTIDHAFYGDCFFTVGLLHYFYVENFF